MRQAQPQGFRHHLRGRRRAQKLTAAAGGAASFATHLGRVIQRDQAMSEASANRLHRAGILSAFGRQGHPAGHDNAGQIATAGQRDHGGRQPFVASRDAHHAIPRRQGADHPAHHQRGVVAIGQAVHHAGRALRAAIAGVGAINGEGDRVAGADRLSRLLDQQADFPMPGVITQGDGTAVFSAQAAFGADDHVLLAVDLFRMPAHRHILRHGEEVAARFVEQHILIDGQLPFPALPTRARRSAANPPRRRFHSCIFDLSDFSPLRVHRGLRGHRRLFSQVRRASSSKHA